MEATVYSLKGRKVRRLELPRLFEAPVNRDLIKRAYLALESHGRQPQGRDPEAGQKTSAESWGVGRGAARPARVKGSRHVTAGRAAGVAAVVKGRQAHPPKVEKRTRKKINSKERRLATISAIASTSAKDLVERRGHRISSVRSIPLVVSDDIQKVVKSSELRSAFESLGLKDELDRVTSGIRQRSGKAARRGRVSRVPRGPLVVVSKDEGISRAAGALPGVECVTARNLSLLDLAPGTHYGRLVVWSESAPNSLPDSLLRMGERF